MPPETEFTSTVINGPVEVTTHFRRGRRGARPFKRIIRRAVDTVHAAAVDGTVTGAFAAAGGGLRTPSRVNFDKTSLPLRLLNDVRMRGVRRVAEAPFRARLARAGVTDSYAVLDSLVSEGIIEREERLDPQGNPTTSYFTLTGLGASWLDSVFGPVQNEPLEELTRLLEGMLDSCKRPAIKEFLERQLDRARSGGPVFLETPDEEPITFTSSSATPGYVRILEFFGFVGAQAPDEPMDFKEVSGSLNRGERDSVKMLESLRTSIAKVAEAELGMSLDDMGIRGAHLLYWIPFCGDLRPDGHVIWGAFPAVSTKDVRSARFFRTSARVIALVENRAALEHLFGCAGSENGWLTICTEGMPKLALYELLSRIDGRNDMAHLIWTDWDVGGLRIAQRLSGFLKTRTQSRLALFEWQSALRPETVKCQPIVHHTIYLPGGAFHATEHLRQ